MILNKFKKFISDNFTDHKKQIHKKAFLLVQQGQFEQLISLWSQNEIEVTYQDERGLNLLMTAVCYSIEHIEEGIQIINFLLTKGADINQTDSGGRSSFLMACHWNLLEIVKIFLQHQPDLDANTKNRYLVLNPTYTVLLKGNYKMAKFLLDNGADYNKIFELHNCTNQISLNSEALEFLYKYKIEKQRIQEKLNLLFIRKQLLEKYFSQYQQNESKQQTQTNTGSPMISKLNNNELKEIMKYI